MKPTRQAWDFLVTILTEPIVYLTSLTTMLLVMVSSRESSPHASLLLAILLTLSAAIFGARLAQIWSTFDESRLLRTKGKSVARHTELVLTALKALEDRVIEVLSRHQTNALSEESVEIHLEEFIGKCKSLRQCSINIIAAWEDVFPEVDLEKQLTELDFLKSRYLIFRKEVAQLDSQIVAARESRAGTDHREKLRKALQQKIGQLNETEEQLHLRAAQFDHSLASLLFSHLDEDRKATVLQTWLQEYPEARDSLVTEVIEVEENVQTSPTERKKQDSAKA